MPEQPQWSERTLDMPPQDPWADAPTTPVDRHDGRFNQDQDHSRYAEVQHTRVQHPQGPPSGPDQEQQHTRVQHPQTQAQRPDESQPHASVPPFGPHGAHPVAPEPSPFGVGRARVTQRAQQQYAADHEPTGTGWPQEAAPDPTEGKPLSWHIRRLRRGSEWSNAPLIFAFVSWGIWVLSSEGSMVTPIIVFVTSVVVAIGVFALARLLGRLVLERQLGRVRHTARGAHMAAGVFLLGVGLAHLQQTEWVMTAVHWVTDLFTG